MWAETLWNHHLLPLQWGVAIGTSLAAAVCDVRTRRVPNLLTGPMLLAGLSWGIWIGGWAGLADSAAGCLLLAIPYVLLFVFAGGESRPSTGGLLCIDPAGGEIDFHFPWRARPPRSVNASSPLVVGNQVFISEYGGITKAYPLDNLPTDEEYLKDTEPEDE